MKSPVSQAALVVIAVVVLAFAFQGRRGIWQPDEGYYAGTAVTMMHRNTLMIPYLGEKEIFLDKPPLIYWGILAGTQLFGQTEFAARLFHAVSFALTCAAVGVLAWSLFRDRRLAWASALVYATMPVPLIAAHFITPDGLLVLWTTLAGLCFWKSTQASGRAAGLWKVLLAGAVGLGFLAKGPAVLIPCLAMFVFLLVRRRVLGYFWSGWSLAALLTFCLIGLGWYAYISWRLPGALAYFFDNQIWGRLVSEKYRRNPGLTGALIYVPVLLAGALPWSAAWFDWRRLHNSILSKRWWQHLPDNPVQLWLVCWIGIPMLILTLASSKLGLYALPVFPPLAIISARAWGFDARADLADTPSGPRRISPRAGVLVGIWIALLLGGRLALASYPTPKDMRALWAAIQDRLPSLEYEICTVDDRADGLLFYAPITLEHLTDEDRAYPTYMGTEHLLVEMQEMADEGERIALLVQDDHERLETCTLLRRANVPYRIISLPGHRSLIVPEVRPSLHPDRTAVPADNP